MCRKGARPQEHSAGESNLAKEYSVAVNESGQKSFHNNKKTPSKFCKVLRHKHVLKSFLPVDHNERYAKTAQTKMAEKWKGVKKNYHHYLDKLLRNCYNHANKQMFVYSSKKGR